MLTSNRYYPEGFVITFFKTSDTRAFFAHPFVLWSWNSRCPVLLYIAALCGGFEKYEIVEDMGFSAKKRRKSSQGTERPHPDDLIRRGSLPVTQKKETLISTGSEPELRHSRPFPTKRTLSEGVVVVKDDFATRKSDRAPKSHSLDLDISSFDFSELRSNSLCSTEL